MRWIVRPGDGRTVGEVLVRAGVELDAVREGRVFVERERVRRPDRPVQLGDELTIAPEAARSLEPIHVLLRKGDLVVVDKPAGMPTIADHEGVAHSLAGRLAATLSIDIARIHATSRLDRDVSGVVVFALTPAAAQRLLHARSEGRYERRYVAIATRAPSPASGIWDAAIGRAKNPRLRAVGGRDAVPASTRFAVVATAGSAALLAVSPGTGRTHQIRLHASNAGAPLVGDKAYGGPTRVTLATGRVLEPGRVALHAARVVVPDEQGEPVLCLSPVPPELSSLWSALGGDAAVWELSLNASLA